MKAMPLLKKTAWLACGVVLSQLIFHLSLLLVVTGSVSGALIPALIALSLSMIAGYALCRRATRLDVFLMGAAIAGYAPLTRGVLWVAAFVQDVMRGDGLPGVSLTVMLNLPTNTGVMLVMALIGLFAALSGLAASKRASSLLSPQ